MNTWFTDIIRHANERLFTDAELTRIMEYYGTIPVRLKLGEELEKLEPELLKILKANLAERFPDRALYSKELLQDLVESLRHVNLAILLDDPKLLRERWTDHVTSVMADLGIERHEVHDAYASMRVMLEKKLTRTTWEIMQPLYDDLADTFTAGTAA